MSYSYSDRVRLDRYAIKDPQAHLVPGDLVVVSVQRVGQDGKARESREIGTVVGGETSFSVEVPEQKSALAAPVTTTPGNPGFQVLHNVERHCLEFIVEKSWAEICQRVAGSIAQVDQLPDTPEYSARLAKNMTEGKFIPAGRILSGAGRGDDHDLTVYNCYVFAIEGDSREAIAKHWGRIFDTFSRGGGVGWDLSRLRPKGNIVAKVNGRSSGVVSWAEQFSQITGAVEQGGCFGGDTQIWTTDKKTNTLQKISARQLADSIDNGETIYANTHKGPKRITAAFRNGIKNLVRVHIMGAFVDVTLEHKMCTQDLVLIPAIELKLGQEIALLYWNWNTQRDEVRYLPVMGVEILQDTQEVFDFEVEDVHLICGNGFYTSNSRRGAALQGLWCWHPDIYDFIAAKSLRDEFEINGQKVSLSKKLLYNANVSVLLSNAFMNAVKCDQDWDLVFPDQKDPEYDTAWTGDIDAWRALGKKVDVYKTVKARDLWNLIITKAWESGEPGLLFMERSNDFSNSYYFNKLICTNPCGEQPLSSNSVCNLSHLNLAQFNLNSTLPTTEVTAEKAKTAFDWDGFDTAVQDGVRFLDDVVDLNKYHDAAIKKQQTGERRVGLGILGYGELLIRLGLRYGSDDALRFTDDLFARLWYKSYEASCKLAMTRGPFPEWSIKFLNSGFMRQQHISHYCTEMAAQGSGKPNLLSMIAEHGMRNVTTNTVAPTGSVSTIFNTTGGIEPYFDLEYTATTRIGTVEEKASVVALLSRQFGAKENWPSYVVTAQSGITPEQHVRTQATAQKWVDSSISKTINAPHEATVQDIADAYMMMWDYGCKGGTVYRDGSRDEQVFYTHKTSVPVPVVAQEIDAMRPRLEVGIGPTFSVPSPVGSLHVTIRHDPKTGDPEDIFITSGKGDIAADVQAIGRLCSLILRLNGVPLSQQSKLELVREQLAGIPGRTQDGLPGQVRISLPDTIAHVITRYLEGNFPLANMPFGAIQVDELCEHFATLPQDALGKLSSYLKAELASTPAPEEPEHSSEHKFLDLCPSCGTMAYHITGSCGYCSACTYSRCG